MRLVGPKLMNKITLPRQPQNFILCAIVSDSPIMPVGRENPQPAFLHLFLNKFDKFHCRWWNKWPQGPRILFLADRNILADQAFNSFSAFPEDAMVRIKPKEVKKTGKVPTNGSIFLMRLTLNGVKKPSLMPSFNE
jgi:hypothetical protein